MEASSIKSSVDRNQQMDWCCDGREHPIKTFQEYVTFVSNIPIQNIKFAAEKSIKWHHSWTRRARPDPFTGQFTGAVVPCDFLNTYGVMGLCSVDPGVKPFFFTIGEDNSDSTSFVSMIQAAILCGWLKRGDILVLDNSRVHFSGEADIIQDLLWEGKNPYDGQPLKIFVVPIPKRSPGLNPVKSLWKILVRRLKVVLPLYQGAGGLKFAANDVMRNFSREDVVQCYNECGYY